MKRVELHIDELVLHGFAPGDRYRIGAAVERELSRLFAQEGTPPSLARGGSIESLDGGVVETKLDSRAEEIGARVALGVYGGLSR